MKIKRKVSIVLAAALVIGSLPPYSRDVSAVSGDTFTQNGINYEVMSDNLSVEITGVTSKEISKLTVPDTVTDNGYDYKVVKMNDELFSGSTTLTSVDLGNNLKELGSKVFYQCTKLSSVRLSPVLDTIGEKTFAEDTALRSIEIPASLSEVTGIYNTSPFYGCVNLDTITFETGTTRIATALFKECTYLETVNIPDTVTAIGDKAFLDCTALSAVTLPEGLESLGVMAFSGCTALAKADLPGGLKEIGYNAFKDCTNLTSMEIPATLEAIVGIYDRRSPFEGCTRLTDITFGDGIKKIPQGLFGGCTFLTSMEIPDTVTEIESFAYTDCTSLETVSLPKNLNTMGYEAFQGCTRLNHVEIPAALEEVNGIYEYRSPFKGCTSLTDITFEKGSTRVANGLFGGCSYLSKITLPDTISYIGDQAFVNCTGLTEISIPDDVEYLGEKAFSGCTRLTEVTLPKYLEEIGYSAFGNCTSLERARIQGDIEKVTGLYESRGIFGECTRLTDITIDPAVTTIPTYLLGNSSLPYVVIPATVTSIQENAFKSCTADFIIYGYTGSAAENYAKENEITFKSVSEAPEIKAPTLGCVPSHRIQQVISGTSSYSKKMGDPSFVLDTKTNNTDKEAYMIYRTNNITALSVDTNGKVTLKGTGTAVITVSSKKTANYTEAEDFKITVTVAKASASAGNNTVKSQPKKKVPKKGTVVKKGGVKYKVTKSSAKAGTVSVAGVSNKKAKSLTIVSTVKINGYSFKVTAIGAGAFKGCKKLKTIKVKSTKLKTVGKKAFLKVPKSAAAKVPKSKKKAYKKLFKKGGFKGKVK